MGPQRGGLRRRRSMCAAARGTVRQPRDGITAARARRRQKVRNIQRRSRGKTPSRVTMITSKLASKKPSPVLSVSQLMTVFFVLPTSPISSYLHPQSVRQGMKTKQRAILLTISVFTVMLCLGVLYLLSNLQCQILCELGLSVRVQQESLLDVAPLSHCLWSLHPL